MARFRFQPVSNGRFPPRLSHFFWAFFAFVIGVLIFTGLMAAFGSALGIETLPERGEEKPFEMILCLAAAMFLTGYGTGRISGRWEILIAAGVGVIMSIGTGPAHLRWQGIDRSLTQPLSWLLLPASAALGGWVAWQFARIRARRRAAMPLPWPLEIRQWTALVWLGFFLSMGMTVALVWVLWEGKAPVRGWSGAVFFGAVTLLLGWSGLRNKPQAILRDDGIKFSAFQAVIPWSEIDDAVPSASHVFDYVRIRVRHPERYLDRLTPFQRFLSQEGETEPNIGLMLWGTPYTGEEICTIIHDEIWARTRAAL